MKRTFLLLAPLLLAGCSQANSLRTTSSDLASQPAEGLVNIAHQSGSMWPITAASALFLLAAIPAFFILDKKQFISLLIIGILLAIVPVVLLKVMDHLVIPAAVLLGITGLAATVFFIGRLWDRWVIRKRGKAEALRLTDPSTPKKVDDHHAAEIVSSLTDKKFKPSTD